MSLQMSQSRAFTGSPTSRSTCQLTNYDTRGASGPRLERQTDGFARSTGREQRPARDPGREIIDQLRGKDVFVDVDTGINTNRLESSRTRTGLEGRTRFSRNSRGRPGRSTRPWKSYRQQRSTGSAFQQRSCGGNHFFPRPDRS